MLGLRLLAALGAALFAAGWAVGWFERGDADEGGPVSVVRPDDVLGAGPVAWLLALPLVVAPLVPNERRRLAVAWVLAVPALVGCALVATMRSRAAVPDETIGEFVVDRPVGQTLSLCGALIVVMVLVAAWRQAPDWRVPPRWAAAAGGAGPVVPREGVAEP